MVMDTIQIRLPKGLVKKAEEVVTEGTYSNRSEVVRDALRSFLIRRMLMKQVGSLKGIIKGDSVELVRKVRKELSSKITNLEELKKLVD